MRILGLDPGSRHTGYGVLEKDGSRLRALAHGRISCSADDPLPDRLVILGRELTLLLERWEPRAVALESLFRGVNVRSLIVLAQARGALLARLAEHGLEIHEYAPAAVKTAVTGNGRAGKEQVGRMVRLLLGLGEVEMSADASDALALALCHAQRRRIDLLERGERNARK